MARELGGYPNRRRLAERYMNTKDPVERRQLAAQLRAFKAASAPRPKIKVIECRWDLSREYVKNRLKAGWTPRECDWCGGLYPARDSKHIYCSRVCYRSAEPAGRSKGVRRAVTYGQH